MNFTVVPLSIDWREKGAVSPVREGACGGWTVSAVDALEGITKIKTGKLFTLSVQEIVDRNSSGNPGCDVGSTHEAFESIKQHGLTTEANYHSGGNGTCNAKIEDESVTKITGYENVLANSEQALMMEVANQPVAVTVDASGSDFQYYSSGVFTGKCGTSLDHGVTVVGYGNVSDNGLKYWLMVD
ncbi:hypothetical protein RHMOL_Rhmol13G0248300 [Rhododendron molle]|uniref:Uncharacterized protein n=1 Tax=Rhododendron molle TaxID=49168 RepID=A0ACC0LAD7_RHOML|nr:hypothetical protein RHMOL_Rhmol13G0248300 [Rhododendron molle]